MMMVILYQWWWWFRWRLCKPKQTFMCHYVFLQFLRDNIHKSGSKHFWGKHHTICHWSFFSFLWFFSPNVLETKIVEGLLKKKLWGKVRKLSWSFFFPLAPSLPITDPSPQPTMGQNTPLGGEKMQIFIFCKFQFSHLGKLWEFPTTSFFILSPLLRGFLILLSEILSLPIFLVLM